MLWRPPSQQQPGREPHGQQHLHQRPAPWHGRGGGGDGPVSNAGAGRQPHAVQPTSRAAAQRWYQQHTAAVTDAPLRGPSSGALPAHGVSSLGAGPAGQDGGGMGGVPSPDDVCCGGWGSPGQGQQQQRRQRQQWEPDWRDVKPNWQERQQPGGRRQDGVSAPQQPPQQRLPARRQAPAEAPAKEGFEPFYGAAAVAGACSKRPAGGTGAAMPNHFFCPITQEVKQHTIASSPFGHGQQDLHSSCEQLPERHPMCSSSSANESQS